MCLDRSAASTSAKGDFNRSTVADWLMAKSQQLIAPFTTKGYTAEKEQPSTIALTGNRAQGGSSTAALRKACVTEYQRGYIEKRIGTV